MSRTKKDYKRNKKWDNRTHEFKAGVKKWWRRLSNKLGRKTPVVKNIPDYHYDEEGNLIEKNVAEVENTPRRGDKWELD